MKRKLIRGIGGIALMLLFSACSFERDDVVLSFSAGNEELLSIGDISCPVSYAKVFLCNYQNIYGDVYGIDLWAHTFAGQDLGAYVKEVSLSELARTISMDALAGSRGVTLSASEQENAAAAAQEYFATLTDAEKEYTGIDEAGLETLYADYALAEKLYHTLTAGVNYEVSEDEARVMTVQELFVTDEQAAAAIAAALAEGTDFATLAAQYNETDQIEKNIRRGELPAEAEAAAYALDNEGISAPVQTAEGWYFFRCINKNVEDLTAENKLIIAQEREKEASDDVYDAFVRDLDSTLNTDLWESVTPDLSGAITTKQFFRVYEQYF